MLKILSWNILQGGGTRIPSIIQKIKLLKPAICVFSEYRNNHSGDKLKILLNDIGYKYQCTTLSEKNENSVMICSFFPFEIELHPDSDPIFFGNIVSAHFDAFSLMGVYLPHKKKHTLFHFINALVSKIDKHYIIMGDFNSGINKLDQIGESFWYEDQMITLQIINYADAFRQFHGY
jgi:exonuclease III